MALYRNRSQSSITFYDPRKPFQEPVPPGHVVNERDHPTVSKHPDFEKISDFWSFVKTHHGAKIAIVRSYALGDVLMVLSILTTLRPELEKRGIQIALFTQRRFWPVFKHIKWLRWGTDEQLALIPAVQRQFDVAFSLNGVLEKDHVMREQGQKNRLRMLAEALGVEGIIET